MTNTLLGRVLFGALALSVMPRTAFTQDSASLAPLIRIANSYRTTPDITYLKVGAVESKLDVHQNRSRTTPAPTIVWIHGGNWVGGSKAASLLSLLPFFEMGWNVVNVDYRLVNVAPAPAAVEDCHCALRWVVEHAADYNIDPAPGAEALAFELRARGRRPRADDPRRCRSDLAVRIRGRVSRLPRQGGRRERTADDTQRSSTEGSATRRCSGSTRRSPRSWRRRCRLLGVSRLAESPEPGA